MTDSMFTDIGTPTMHLSINWAPGPFDKAAWSLWFAVADPTAKTGFREIRQAHDALSNDGDTPTDFSDILEAAIKAAYRIVLAEKLTAVHLARRRML